VEVCNAATRFRFFSPFPRRWSEVSADPQIVGYRHHLVLLSVVGTSLSLPVDVEPYGPDDSEYDAGQRLLRRAVDQLGRKKDFMLRSEAWVSLS